jgi:hypothetical protein
MKCPAIVVPEAEAREFDGPATRPTDTGTMEEFGDAIPRMVSKTRQSVMLHANRKGRFA